ncbi:replication-associated recombination protein A [Belnapia rosea]|uniref:replication-associated recombination protein A n=1 Tax=Belnapia rosea TaxID=938405 RepID=UPI000886D6D4|nr:replication-associated recombination protein A [Belnapia rosea]SDB55730.1 putative ATPase [Belnapia rosea]
MAPRRSPDTPPADLFGEAAPPPPRAEAPTGPRPLADRLRPAELEEVVGQDHLVGPAGALTGMLARGALASLILWGPPGVGKTTIARLLAERAGLVFVQLSAVFSGVADLKRAFDEARQRRRVAPEARGRMSQGTLLFVDEIHRFNRAQQDGFLPVVEDGTVTLVGATTENPSFALNGALLSRCQVLVLRRLDEAALDLLLTRAEAEAGHPLPLDPAARASLKAMADGDGRYLLNLAEQLLALPPGQAPLDATALGELLARRAALYDKDREEHYNQCCPLSVPDIGSQINALLSAFHKSLRGSDPDAALYYAARFLVTGPDAAPQVFRRLACAASEDVGMADPQALVQVITAWQAFERVGWPEGRLFVAQAVSYVATAPKSNAAYMAFTAALELAGKTPSASPPLNALNAPTKMMKAMGYHAGYEYDHDTPEGYAGQNFWPEGVGAHTLYEPTERGFEREIGKRLRYWNGLKAKRQS